MNFYKLPVNGETVKFSGQDVYGNVSSSNLWVSKLYSKPNLKVSIFLMPWQTLTSIIS